MAVALLHLVPTVRTSTIVRALSSNRWAASQDDTPVAQTRPALRRVTGAASSAAATHAGTAVDPGGVAG
ncbi:MAG: hypothetical protein R2713_18635 [Ilumatobacteraceae bacterium]